MCRQVKFFSPNYGASHLLLYVIGCACSVLHFCNACREHDVPARGSDLHHPRIDSNISRMFPQKTVGWGGDQEPVNGMSDETSLLLLLLPMYYHWLPLIETIYSLTGGAIKSEEEEEPIREPITGLDTLVSNVVRKCIQLLLFSHVVSVVAVVRRLRLGWYDPIPDQVLHIYDLHAPILNIRT